jgi:hypothetical protein
VGWGQGGEMTQALYAHMNNKTINKFINIKKKREKKTSVLEAGSSSTLFPCEN